MGLYYINFEVSRETKRTVQYTLVKFATEDAVNKANIMAEPLGIEVVNIRQKG
jgi:uncharacterized protein YggE